MEKILDLGAGENPYFLRYDIKFRPEDEYFLAEVNDQRLIRAKLKIAEYFKNTKKTFSCTFKICDAKKLPFGQGEFDKIIVGNFFSAPLHWLWDRESKKLLVKNLSGFIKRKLLSGNPKLVFYTERKKYLQEALRVLKSGGRMLIYTDLIVYGLESYKKLLNDLKSSKSYKVRLLRREMKRVDLLNAKKLNYKDAEWDFVADVLPRCEVWEVTKL